MLEASPRLRNPTKRNSMDRMMISMTKASAWLSQDFYEAEQSLAFAEEDQHHPIMACHMIIAT